MAVDFLVLSNRRFGLIQIIKVNEILILLNATRLVVFFKNLVKNFCMKSKRASIDTMMVLAIALLSFSALPTLAQQKTFIDPYPAGYSAAVVSEGGRTIQVSGVTARDAAGKARGNLRMQTEQVYEQIGQVLEKAGATFADIVKMTIYVVNYRPEDLPMIREVRARFLDQQRPPASTLVGVQALFSPDVLIEVDVVAVAK